MLPAALQCIRNLLHAFHQHGVQTLQFIHCGCLLVPVYTHSGCSSWNILHGGFVCSQVEVPEWYVPGAVRAASPERPRVTADVQASHAAAQEVAAAFDITHGEESSQWL